MSDMGLKLSEKDDDIKDLDEMLERINLVVYDYGFRISQWGEWEKFKESCVKEKIFIDKLLEKIND